MPRHPRTAKAGRFGDQARASRMARAERPETIAGARPVCALSGLTSPTQGCPPRAKKDRGRSGILSKWVDPERPPRWSRQKQAPVVHTIVEECELSSSKGSLATCAPVPGPSTPRELGSSWGIWMRSMTTNQGPAVGDPRSAIRRLGAGLRERGFELTSRWPLGKGKKWCRTNPSDYRRKSLLHRTLEIGFGRTLERAKPIFMVSLSWREGEGEGSQDMPSPGSIRDRGYGSWNESGGRTTGTLSPPGCRRLRRWRGKILCGAGFRPESPAGASRLQANVHHSRSMSPQS
jgi:hypothetical protein